MSFFDDELPRIGDDPRISAFPLQLFTQRLDDGNGNDDVGYFFANASPNPIGPGRLQFDLSGDFSLRDGSQITESFGQTPGIVVNVITKSGGTFANPSYSLTAEWEDQVEAEELLAAFRVPYADVDTAGGTFTFTYGDDPGDAVTIDLPTFFPPVPGETFDFIGGTVLDSDVTDYQGSVLVDDFVIQADSSEARITLQEVDDILGSVSFEADLGTGTVYTVKSAERLFFDDISELDLGTLTEDGFLDVVKLNAITGFAPEEWGRVTQLHFAHTGSLMTAQDAAEYVFGPSTIFENGVPVSFGSAYRALTLQLAEQDDDFNASASALNELITSGELDQQNTQHVELVETHVQLGYQGIGREADTGGLDYYRDDFFDGNIDPFLMKLVVQNGTNGVDADPNDRVFLDVLSDGGIRFGLLHGMTNEAAAQEAAQALIENRDQFIESALDDVAESYARFLEELEGTSLGGDGPGFLRLGPSDSYFEAAGYPF